MFIDEAKILFDAWSESVAAAADRQLVGPEPVIIESTNPCQYCMADTSYKVCRDCEDMREMAERYEMGRRG